MREIVFRSSKFPSTSTSEERDAAQQIWAAELAKGRANLPAFVLLGDVRQGDKRLIFSMFDAAGSDMCEESENGHNAKDIYTVCRLRVVSWPVQGTKAAELPGYCMVSGGDHPMNRVEYRYDTAVQTMHFRTIQYGKVVPACNRALKLS